MSDYAAIEKEARIFTEECVTNNHIDPTLFAQYDIKRGLRDKNGKGVLAGGGVKTPPYKTTINGTTNKKGEALPLP